MSKFEQIPETEQMEMPTTEIKEEKGLSLLSLMFKGCNLDWGEKDNALAIKARKFFSEHPLKPETISFLLNDQVDEETLYNVALTYGNDKRKKALFDFLAKHKTDVVDPEQLQNELMTLLAEFSEYFSGDFHDEIQQAIETDIQKREGQLDETISRIRNLLVFFKPRALTTGVKKLIILPTDFFIKNNLVVLLFLMMN